MSCQLDFLNNVVDTKCTLLDFSSKFLFSYRKKGLTARKRLAAIDWNYHLDTKTAVNMYGETSVSRKYNQRTKTWNVKILKESKDYQYIWMLMAKVFRLRSEDEGGVKKGVWPWMQMTHAELLRQ